MHDMSETILAGNGEEAVGLLLRIMPTQTLLDLLRIGRDKIVAKEETGEQQVGTMKLTLALMAELLRRRNEATAEEAAA